MRKVPGHHYTKKSEGAYRLGSSLQMGAYEGQRAGASGGLPLWFQAEDPVGVGQIAVGKQLSVSRRESVDILPRAVNTVVEEVFSGHPEEGVEQDFFRQFQKLFSHFIFRQHDSILLSNGTDLLLIVCLLTRN